MYAIYLRKSRADLEYEDEIDTLIKHEKTLLELAEKRKLEIGKIYKEVVSGDTIAARPQMQQLLQDVGEHMYEGVLVMEIERLARGDTIDQGIVAQTFKISDTKIITPIKTYDPNNEYDEEYFEFGLFMSRREFKTIKRRLNAGRLRSVKDGNYIGSVSPYGYDKAVIDRRHTLVPNEYEADIVRMIFNWFCEGMSKHAIADKLNSMNITTKYGKKWLASGVRDLLYNPIYIGRVKWDNRKVIKANRKGKFVESRPRPTDVISYQGIHEPIIDMETWNKSQELNKEQIPSNVRDVQLKNPLSGVVFCSVCGHGMQRRPYVKRGQEPTLICVNKGCTNVSSPLYLVEEKVIKIINELYTNYKYEKKDNTTKMVSTKKQYENQLQKEKAKLDRIFQAYEDGIYTKKEFADRKKSVEDKIMELKNLISKETNQITKKEMLHRLQKFVELYESANIQEKNDLLKSVVEKIMYTKTKKCLKKRDNPSSFELDFYLKYQGL